MKWSQYLPNPARPGYAYELTSTKSWKTAPDDDWDTVVLDGRPAAKARLLGKRRIDGAMMRVYKAGSRIVAQTDVGG